MRKIILAGILALGVQATPVAAKKAPVMTPLELQALQSREFETSKENLFGAVMTVLQDLGYQVQTADMQTGFVTAVSATKNKTSFLEAFGGARSSGNTKVTSFIQALPNGATRVRLNFLNTKITSMSYGQTSQDDKPILDPVAYRTAWEKIDEALFVMGALEASPKAASPSAPASPAPPAPTAAPNPTPETPAKAQ